MRHGGFPLETPPSLLLEGSSTPAPHRKWACTSRGTPGDMGEYMDRGMILVEVGRNPKARYLWTLTGKIHDSTLEGAWDWALGSNIPAGPDVPLEVSP